MVRRAGKRGKEGLERAGLEDQGRHRVALDEGFPTHPKSWPSDHSGVRYCSTKCCTRHAYELVCSPDLADFCPSPAPLSGTDGKCTTGCQLSYCKSWYRGVLPGGGTAIALT